MQRRGRKSLSLHSRFFPLHEEGTLLDRQYILMEEFGACVPLDQVDLRSLVYLSDKVAKQRQVNKQNATVQRNRGKGRR